MGEFFVVALVAIIYEGLLGNLWLGLDTALGRAPPAGPLVNRENAKKSRKVQERFLGFFKDLLKNPLTFGRYIL